MKTVFCYVCDCEVSQMDAIIESEEIQFCSNKCETFYDNKKEE